MKRRIDPTRRPQRDVIPAALQLASLKTLTPRKTDFGVSLAKFAGATLALLASLALTLPASARDANATAAPVPHVEYSAKPSAKTPQDKPPVAALSVTQLAAPPQTVIADASGSTDTDATPIASYRFDFGDGTRVTTLAPVATAQHSYRSAGGYTVTVIVTDTGGRSSGRLSRQITVTPPPPVDYPPVARLTVAQLTSPPLTVRADASNSTDTDGTPIAKYTLDFGDGSSAVTLLAPTANAQHTYAAPGTYTVTLIAVDTGNQTSAPASAILTLTAVAGPQIAVYGGYYDTHHAVNPKPKPDPWQGSANTVFVGQPDNQPKDPPTGAWDTSALRVDNLTSAPLTGVVVTVDIGTMHRALWGTNTIPPGNHLILTQTVFENFDVPDKYPAGCYGCDPNLCVTMRSAEIPVVHVTIGGTTTDYPDTGQTINTDGYDAAGCPYVGGPLPQTRYDESRNWVQLFPAVAPPRHAVPAALASATPEGFGRAAAYSVSLAPPSPNPARGELRLRFSTARHGPARVGVFDVTGRLVRPVIDSVLDPGSYSVALDVGRIPAGVYFVRLWTPETTLHEKVAVMN